MLRNRLVSLSTILFALAALPGTAAAECVLRIAATSPAPPPRKTALLRHQVLLTKIASARAEVVLIGDSIALQWPDDLLTQIAGDRPTLNLGVGGDRTEHVLWRLDQTHTDLSSVATYVVAIGTNNLAARYPACAITAGINAITSVLKNRSPYATIFILHIPAIYREGGKEFEAARQAVNGDLTRGSLESIALSGTLTCSTTDCKNYKKDRVHLSPQAYAAISREIEIKISQGRRPH